MTRLSLGMLVLASLVCLVAGTAHAASPPSPPALSPLEQALTQVASEDEAVREAALRDGLHLVALGDGDAVGPGGLGACKERQGKNGGGEQGSAHPEL